MHGFHQFFMLKLVQSIHLHKTPPKFRSLVQKQFSHLLPSLPKLKQTFSFPDIIGEFASLDQIPFRSVPSRICISSFSLRFFWPPTDIASSQSVQNCSTNAHIGNDFRKVVVECVDLDSWVPNWRSGLATWLQPRCRLATSTGKSIQPPGNIQAGPGINIS